VPRRTSFRVQVEPLGEGFECGSEETVLDAAFRSGYLLAHGCREGQCSACKSFLLEGEVDLKPHSSFALTEAEEERGYALLCRAVPVTDVVVELLHFDPENYRLEVPIQSGEAAVELVEALTHDMRQLRIRLDPGADFSFRPGQYVELWRPDGAASRSYSMSSRSGEPAIEFLIRRYPGGSFSGLLDGDLRPGDRLAYRGPYGNMFLRPGDGPVLLVAGGSGLGPILSLLRDLAEVGSRRPVHLVFGVRRRLDLHSLDLLESLGSRLAEFQLLAALSEPLPDDRGEGETGFAHEVLERALGGRLVPGTQAYVAGPPPMVDAVLEALLRLGLDETSFHCDRFTLAAGGGGA